VAIGVDRMRVDRVREEEVRWYGLLWWALGCAAWWQSNAVVRSYGCAALPPGQERAALPADRPYDDQLQHAHAAASRITPSALHYRHVKSSVPTPPS
jgi:hypothetical protein